jgi:CHAT domain-containing protein
MGKGFGTGKQKKGKQKQKTYQDFRFQVLQATKNSNTHYESKQQKTTAYLNFLLQVLQASHNSNHDPRVVYPILKENLDKLDDNFAQLFKTWATVTLSEVGQRYAPAIARSIALFSILIQEFPNGSKAFNQDFAITGYEIALLCYTRKMFPEQWASAKNCLGNAYSSRIRGDRAENLERALAAYQSALEVATRQAFPELWATIHNNMAIAYFDRRRGDRAENLEKAIAFYQSSLEVVTREAFPEKWASAHNNLGNAYFMRIRGNRPENLEKAIAAYEAALEVRRREAFPEQWATTQSNLANAYIEWKGGNCIENLERAIAAYKAALRVYTCEVFPEQWARTQKNLASAYLVRLQGDRPKNLETAIAIYESACTVYTSEAFPEEWATTQNNLGYAYQNLGQIDKAIRCFQLALEILRPSTFPDACLQSGRHLGDAAFQAKQWLEATEGYATAIEAVETSRSWATSESRRQEILAEAIDVYQNMVQACINSGQMEKAIEYVERSRSKRLVDLMASNDLYQSDEVSPEVKELLQQFDELQQRIDQEHSQNNSGNNRELMGVGGSTSDRAAFQAYNEAIASLEAEKQQIWEQLRRLNPVLAGEIQVSAPDFAAMQELIDQPTTALLSFYTTSNDTHIFILRKNQIILHTCTGQGIKTLQSWIFQNWLFPYVAEQDTWKNQTNNFLTELAQRLQLSELISQHLEGIKELILVPHLFLHQLPFAALSVGNGQYLADKFLIRYTPSCQVLEFCQKRPHLGDSLTYGTVEDATEDLPCAGFEGEQIARLHNVPEDQRLKGKAQATVKNYRELTKKVQVIHSSHHAESRLDNPLESVLKLADGTITLGQLMTPSWRLPDLSDVFLSCCETGLGVTEITDDILTFSTGFLCAGARSVVSTLWSVDDLATAMFSIFYYQHRKQRRSRPEALQHAQIKLRQLSKEEFLSREDIKEFYEQAKVRKEEADKKRKQYQRRSAECLKWTREYLKYREVTTQINTIKSSLDKFPFSHPCYWAAFTCSGLR